MLWRGATSAWLHVGCDAKEQQMATAAVVQALLRGMVLALTAMMRFCDAGLELLLASYQCSNSN
jgi:hypothetical protein